MRPLLRPLLLAVLLALPCFALASYYPSTPGTVWKLSSGETQTLAPPVSVRGVKVTPLKHLLGGKLVSEDLLEFRGGSVLLRGTRANGALNWFAAPLTVYPPSPLSPGQTWTSTAGGFTLSARVTGQQPLTTAAGKFNALVIRNQVTTASGGASASYSYFVPGIGTVRYLNDQGVAVDLLK